MILPNKELLSAVLEREISEIVECSNNSINIYSAERSFLGQYNIYELAHKVKEWAYANGYEINSNWRGRITIWTTEFTPRFAYDAYSEIVQCEYEAIFEAGEWILQNIARKIQ